MLNKKNIQYLDYGFRKDKSYKYRYLGDGLTSSGIGSPPTPLFHDYRSPGTSIIMIAVIDDDNASGVYSFEIIIS